MVEEAKGSNSILRPRRGPSRRNVLKAGAAAAAISGFPYVSRGLAAQTLKFWQFYGPGGGVATQDKWYQDVVKDWNDSHDVKVELVYVPNNAYMDGTKLPTAFASGSGPDLFIISPGDFLRYYNGGVLLDLTPFMEQAARDDFIPSVIANRMVDGKIYGLPYEVEPMAMYYSVDAFAEIGLTEKDVPKTWDELLTIGKKLTNAKRFGVLFETAPGYYQNFTWYPFLWEGGGDFQTKDGKSAFNSPATVQALKFWQDAVNMGVSPRKPLGGGGWDVVPNLASGYCAMQNVGIWAIAQLREGAPDFKYGIFKLPTPPGGKYITIGGGWAFVANARGSNPKAAGEFCAWALGTMKPGLDCAHRRLVHQGEERHAAQNLRLGSGQGGVRQRLPQSVHRRDLSWRARRAAHAPAGLQGDFGRDPGLPAQRAESRAGGGRRVRADRCVPRRLQGRPDPLDDGSACRALGGRQGRGALAQPVVLALQSHPRMDSGLSLRAA